MLKVYFNTNKEYPYFAYRYADFLRDRRTVVEYQVVVVAVGVVASAIIIAATARIVVISAAFHFRFFLFTTHPGNANKWKK